MATRYKISCTDRAESFTETKTFTKDKLLVKGTSTGTTNLTTANTSATSYTATFPAKDGTVAMTSDIVSQVEDNITDGHTTIAPSGNAVFDALALKSPLASPAFTTQITTPKVLASSNDSGALGASGTAFSDLFLADGGVINWNAGNATLTHSAGLLTSNVPLSLGVSNALTAGTIELGHASDTTISRVSAGKIAVEGVTVPAIAPSTTGNVMTSNGTDWVSSAPTSATDTQKIGVGSASNTTWENYQFQFGSSTTTTAYFGWTALNSVTPNQNICEIGAGIRSIYHNIADSTTGASMLFSNSRQVVIEWDAVIASDTTTAYSTMGLSRYGTDLDSYNNAGYYTIAFVTGATGSWYIQTCNGTNVTATGISTPSAGKHTFRIEWNPGSNAIFYIDGSSVGTITTYLPTSASCAALLVFGNHDTSVIISRVTAPSVAIHK
jgi:hypothetical protein